MTQRISINEKSLAISCLRDGGIVSFPTDTIYGVACRFDNQESQNRLKIVKGRPEEKPFPLVVGTVEQCELIAEIDERTKKIIRQWWPGALTLVLKKKKNLPDWMSNGKDTVAVRMINMPEITEIIQGVGVPLYLTSANLSDEPVCQSAQEVMEKLGGRVDLVIDGELRQGQASTILDCTQSKLIVLREGPISLEEIEKKMEEKL